MVFSKHSTAFPDSLLTYPLDTIDEDSVGSTIPAFPCSKPTPVTDSPPILVIASDRIFDTPPPHQSNWTIMKASARTLPTGLRPHTTTVHDMLPSRSIRLIGTTPVVTIMDKYVNPEEPSDLQLPTASYPSPHEPNYYVPLLDPPPPPIRQNPLPTNCSTASSATLWPKIHTQTTTTPTHRTPPSIPTTHNPPRNNYPPPSPIRP